MSWTFLREMRRDLLFNEIAMFRKRYTAISEQNKSKKLSYYYLSLIKSCGFFELKTQKPTR